MNRSEKFEQIRTIADAICAKEVTSEQIDNLDKMLAGNPEAQQFYYDYIETHIQLQAEVGPSMEVVRRRLMVDEVIFRPSHQQAASSNSITHTPLPAQGIPKKWLILTIILTTLVMVTLAWFFVNFGKQGQVAELISEDALRIEGSGKIEANLVYPGVYWAIKPATLTLLSGEQLTLAKHSLVKLYNSAEIELMRGRLSIENASGKNLIVNTENFSIHTGGGKLAIDLTPAQPQVTASAKALLHPKRWRPNHYWPFESTSDRVVDYAGNAFGVLGSGVTKVNGLVGQYAFAFDNGAHARINVGSGGGTAPATGSFSVIDGVTIEALVVPHFTGQIGDEPYFAEQDQIFRKDQTDKLHRMLLSFKKIGTNHKTVPKGLKGNAIAFGMYLIGQGYHTLLLPLDGKEGRPSLRQLKDGNAHHIVGSYDVKTGLKAIFVDGEMLASYQYPAGTKMISGGSGMANIGNNPNRAGDAEAYGGIIDEVAFYDFAIPAHTVRQHYQAAMAGKNYFNIDFVKQALPFNIRIPLPDNEVVIIDALSGLIVSTKPIGQ
ncbi:LamG-like jellyroll fold domain-containing protein [Algibacillus agarilyticus]|uniref:LamG-like jellyroll fold domain-containing protein n=1 Tax=Algibacillus agarilyticus TaxID=2234133 RepID=UPI000DD0B513|nr:LamG-like jellyroll fold domain-containing protein [Algibacillus agarilyticus]